MKKNTQKEFGWNIFSVGLSLVLFLVAVFLTFSNWRILTKALDSIKFRNLAEANLDALEKREAELFAKVADLETESGIDREIRERFPVAKQGEEVIMIINADKERVFEEGAIQGAPTFWQRMKDWWESQ